MSEIEIISKKLFEYSGSGRVLYVNGSEFDVNFSLQMLQNGKINGELYFHFQENNYPRLLECLKNIVALYSLWLFGHFPLVVAITSVGVGLGYITSSEHGLALTYSEQWLVCGSVALSLGAQGILHLSSAYYYLYAGSTQDYRGSRKWATYRIISAGMILLIPILRIPLSPFLLVCILAAICTAQIVIDLKQHPYHRRRRVLK